MKEMICNQIYYSLIHNRNLTETYKLRLKYGIYSLYNSLSILSVILIVSIVLGNMWLSLIAVVSFNFLRTVAYGVHAKTLLGCAVISTFILVLVPMWLATFNIGREIIFILALFIPVFMWFYAPSSTAKTPVAQAYKMKLKKRSVFRGLILGGLAVVISIPTVSIYILVGAYGQVFSNLPIAYQLFKERS